MISIPSSVKLFAFLQDSHEFNKYSGGLHGELEAEFVASIKRQNLALMVELLDKLFNAIRHHSGGLVHSCTTI